MGQVGSPGASSTAAPMSAARIRADGLEFRIRAPSAWPRDNHEEADSTLGAISMLVVPSSLPPLPRSVARLTPFDARRT